MKQELIITGDGSHTLFLPEVNEHYHSYHGAINESEHVFIKNGLLHCLENKFPAINILEVGMGTGLNVFLTLLYFMEHPGNTINYTALEPNPIDDNIIQQLNYTSLLKAEKYFKEFKLIHKSEFENKTTLSEQFLFTKMKVKIQDAFFSEEFHLVYFDAFAPRVQPDLWISEVFRKIYALLKPQGVLVTYCAKGEVKRTLKGCGFNVESLAGPPGKREMIRATKLI